MNLARCDYCCDVLDGVDDGVVFELSEKAQKETAYDYEHLCESCFNHINSDCITLVIKSDEYGNKLIKHTREG